MGIVDSGEFSHFCELPDDLTEEILVWLPVEYLCRFSSVCKQWKTLFSSTRFITTQWLETPPNKNPLLLVGAVDYHRECSAYSFFTHSWQSCSLFHSFIEEKEGQPFTYRPLFRYIASGAGLFLIGGVSTDSIYLCNPFTGKCLKLTNLTYMIHYLMGEVGIVEEGENGYKVVAVCAPGTQQRQIVKIYDSRDKVWKTAGEFQENLILHSSVTNCEGLVFPGRSFFFSLAALDGVQGIVRFDMRDSTYVFVALPPPAENGIAFFNYLLKCGSRVVLVAEVEKEMELNDEGEFLRVEDVVIWEYIDGAAPQWKLISRMPPTIFAGRLLLSEPLTLLQYTGMGNCVYVRVQGVGWKQVAVFNLDQNSWSMLPDCWFPRDEISEHPPFFGFTPRPDIQVD